MKVLCCASCCHTARTRAESLPPRSTLCARVAVESLPPPAPHILVSNHFALSCAGQEHADARETQPIATRTRTGPDAARGFRVQRPELLVNALWDIDVIEATSDEDEQATAPAPVPRQPAAATTPKWPPTRPQAAQAHSATASADVPMADMAAEATDEDPDVWALLGELHGGVWR